MTYKRLLLLTLLCWGFHLTALHAQFSEFFVGKKNGDWLLVDIQLPVYKDVPRKLDKWIARRLFDVKDSTISQAYSAYLDGFKTKLKPTKDAIKKARNSKETIQLKWYSYEDGRYASFYLCKKRSDADSDKRYSKRHHYLYNLEEMRVMKLEDIFEKESLSAIYGRFRGRRHEPIVRAPGVLVLNFRDSLNEEKEAIIVLKDYKELFKPSFLRLMGIEVEKQELTADNSNAAVNDTTVYNLPDTKPEFVGGSAALFRYLSAHIKYPAEALKNGQEGNVVVSFVIGKDGNVRDTKVVRKAFPLLDAEALRLINGMPKWKPGIIEGRPVAVKMTLPVKFKLSKKDTTQQQAATTTSAQQTPTVAETPKSAGAEISKPIVAETPKPEPMLPKEPSISEKTFVIIIANEHYQEEVPVEFALNDGEEFRKCCINELGISKDNIHFRRDATLNHIRRELQWLKDVANVYDGDIRIIVYYAGHGMPDEKTQESYLLPVDGSVTSLITGYKLDNFYTALSEIPSKEVIVFLDACFSGSNRGKGMLTSARGLAHRVKSKVPDGKMVVFSAAQSNETAYPFREKEHGMFTYFLLTKLQESHGAVSLGELKDYVSTEVSRRSVVVNGKKQTPTLTPSVSMGTEWKELKLK